MAFIVLLLMGAQSFAQDTLRGSVLRGVEIRQSRMPSVTQSATPTQVTTQDELEDRGTLQVSEAVKEMAGVTLKDYGGVGGVKTISMRGLGSQFCTLTIDGVAVNDAQNGQVDLGRYLVGGMSLVSLVSGQESGELQTARAFASSSVLNMETAVPRFYGKKHNATFSYGGGSFGLANPSLYYEQKLGRKTSMTLYANYLKCDGDYPFRLEYGTREGDSSSVERRSNSQVEMATMDANLFYFIDSCRSLTGKVHYMQGFHALPGPVTFYSVKGSESTEERLFFAQARYRHRWNERLSSQIVGKYQLSNDSYQDTASRMSATGYLRNDYAQQEGYLSVAADYSPLPCWTFGLASDEAFNRMKSNLSSINHVSRLSSQDVLRASYRDAKGRVEADGHLLATLILDHPATHLSDGAMAQEEPRSYHHVSPYLGISCKLGASTRLRYFFKETFRAPNFNEMYYFALTRDLQPEKATQHNVGVTFLPLLSDSVRQNSCLEAVRMTLDVYYNGVSNKIIAVPTQNMFLWSMMNLGKVSIDGCDLSALCSWWLNPVRLSMTANYSFQYAVDRTDPASKTYNNQIPYTPRNSGNLSLVAELPWLQVGASASLVGERYSMQQNTDYSRLDGYVDLGLNVSKEWMMKGWKVKVAGQVMNLLDEQYEIVKSYPMMGRNFRIRVIVMR